MDALYICHKGYDKMPLEDALNIIRDSSFTYSNLPLYIHFRYNRKFIKANINSSIDSLAAKMLNIKKIMSFPPLKDDCQMHLLSHIKEKFIIIKEKKQNLEFQEEEVSNEDMNIGEIRTPSKVTLADTSPLKKTSPISLFKSEAKLGKPLSSYESSIVFSAIKQDIMPKEEIRISREKKGLDLNPTYYWAKGAQICEYRISSNIGRIMMKSFFDYYGCLGYSHFLKPVTIRAHEIYILGLINLPIQQKDCPIGAVIKFSIIDSKLPNIGTKPWECKKLECISVNLNIDAAIPLPQDPIQYDMLVVQLAKDNGDVICTSSIILQAAKHGIRWVSVYDHNAKKLAFTKMILHIKQ